MFKSWPTYQSIQNFVFGFDIVHNISGQRNNMYIIYIKTGERNMQFRALEYHFRTLKQHTC